MLASSWPSEVMLMKVAGGFELPVKQVTVRLSPCLTRGPSPPDGNITTGSAAQG